MGGSYLLGFVQWRLLKSCRDEFCDLAYKKDFLVVILFSVESV